MKIKNFKFVLMDIFKKNLNKKIEQHKETHQNEWLHLPS